MNTASSPIVILGGGLAGLAAASKLGEAGVPVTLLESKNRLGGRAGSFTDPVTNQVIDACQHVSMGCCNEFAEFTQRVGIDQQLQKESTLYFMTPDRRVSVFQADAVPAPFHLTRAFHRLHYLTWTEKLRLIRGLLQLLWTNSEEDGPLLPWLKRHGQTENLIRRFWSVVLVSALNESIEHVGRKYARKVFLDGFFRSRSSYEVHIPKGALAEFYGESVLNWFQHHQVQIELNTAATSLQLQDNRIVGIPLRSGETLPVEHVIAAVPFSRLLDLLPEQQITAEPYFSQLKAFETSPITSVHLWYDQSIMDLPHVVLIDCLGHWVFRRLSGELQPNEYYLQVVVSASGELKKLGSEKIKAAIQQEMETLFPKAKSAQLLRSKVVTEHAATFRPVPGIDRFRPLPESPISNLIVAGDWTATGWPATMEGAVRSGHRAAAVLLHRIRGAT